MPLVNFLADHSRRIANKRIANLRHKCDEFIFKISYGKGIENVADSISRNKDWNKAKDANRLPEVSNNQHIYKENEDHIRREISSVTWGGPRGIW